MRFYSIVVGGVERFNRELTVTYGSVHFACTKWEKRFTVTISISQLPILILT